MTGRGLLCGAPQARSGDATAWQQMRLLRPDAGCRARAMSIETNRVAIWVRAPTGRHVNAVTRQ